MSHDAIEMYAGFYQEAAAEAEELDTLQEGRMGKAVTGMAVVAGAAAMKKAWDNQDSLMAGAKSAKDKVVRGTKQAVNAIASGADKLATAHERMDREQWNEFGKKAGEIGRSALDSVKKAGGKLRDTAASIFPTIVLPSSMTNMEKIELKKLQDEEDDYELDTAEYTSWSKRLDSFLKGVNKRIANDKKKANLDPDGGPEESGGSGNNLAGQGSIQPVGKGIKFR